MKGNDIAVAFAAKSRLARQRPYLTTAISICLNRSRCAEIHRHLVFLRQLQHTVFATIFLQPIMICNTMPHTKSLIAFSAQPKVHRSSIKSKPTMAGVIGFCTPNRSKTLVLRSMQKPVAQATKTAKSQNILEKSSRYRERPSNKRVRAAKTLLRSR